MGTLAGFLFGIPKSIQSKNSASETNPNLSYTSNDNLVEISDWLTKIIVGVGLTQLASLPKHLQNLGPYLSAGIGATSGSKAEEIAAASIVLFFTICGFLLSYLWTGLYFIKMLQKSREDFNNINFKKLDTKIEKIGNYLSTGVQMMPGAGEKENFVDLQKGKWGGQSKNNDRELTAIVTPYDSSNEYYNIQLTLKSTNDSKPIANKAIFYLNSTFRNPEPNIDIYNGQATLNLLAYRPFTIGVLCDDGQTKLELDLATIDNAPQSFKNYSNKI